MSNDNKAIYNVKHSYKSSVYTGLKTNNTCCCFEIALIRKIAKPASNVYKSPNSFEPYLIQKPMEKNN